MKARITIDLNDYDFCDLKNFLTDNIHKVMFEEDNLNLYDTYYPEQNRVSLNPTILKIELEQTEFKDVFVL